jgi:hypothetical protein
MYSINDRSYGVDFNINEIVEGGFLEIKQTRNIEHVGLWRIIQVEKSLIETSGECQCTCITLSRDVDGVEHRIYIESHLEVNKDVLFILSLFDKFSEQDIGEWLPPLVIPITDRDERIDYISCNIEEVTHSSGNEGCSRISNRGRKFIHWEYETEDKQNILQITSENNYITMFIGYPISTAIVELK